MRCKYFTVNKYYTDLKANKAKGLTYPHLRGKLLPSVDQQIDGGVALNWLYIRIKIRPPLKLLWETYV
jgi:hypothetical protein